MNKICCLSSKRNTSWGLCEDDRSASSPSNDEDAAAAMQFNALQYSPAFSCSTGGLLAGWLVGGAGKRIHGDIHRILNDMVINTQDAFNGTARVGHILHWAPPGWSLELQRNLSPRLASPRAKPESHSSGVFAQPSPAN